MAYLNKYAEIARDFLKRNDPKQYASLKKQGKLDAHLARIGEEVADEVESISLAYLAKNPAPVDDFLKRHAHMVHAQEMAEEVALDDLVFNALPIEDETEESPI